MNSMYIRTKNGRIIDTAKIVTGSKFMDFATNDESFRVIFKTEPLAKSESLEELCDEFVCEWFDKEVNRPRHVYCRFKIGQSKELYRRDIPLPADVNFEIYAGIWVNGNGLTYVAKIDNEGKLVLI